MPENWEWKPDSLYYTILTNRKLSEQIGGKKITCDTSQPSFKNSILFFNSVKFDSEFPSDSEALGHIPIDALNVTSL